MMTPLGDPSPHAPKWFAAVEIIRLVADKNWWHKTTKEIAKSWRQKRERRINPLNVKAGFGPPPRLQSAAFSGRCEHS